MHGGVRRDSDEGLDRKKAHGILSLQRDERIHNAVGERSGFGVRGVGSGGDGGRSYRRGATGMCTERASATLFLLIRRENGVASADERAEVDEIDAERGRSGGGERVREGEERRDVALAVNAGEDAELNYAGAALHGSPALRREAGEGAV